MPWSNDRFHYSLCFLTGLAAAWPLSVALNHAFATLRSRRSTAVSIDIDTAVQEILQAFPDQSSSSLDDRVKYSTNWGSLSENVPASVVVWAKSTQDVQRAVRLANKLGFCIIPIAGRTALEGQFLPPTCCSSSSFSTGQERRQLSRPSIHLSVEHMKRIQLYEQDQMAELGPGIGWYDLNNQLKEQGVKLFFPVDPAPGALFGGMVAVAGSGTRAVSYGTMRADWIMNLEVVLADGSVMRTRGLSRAKKSSAGIDLHRLFMGSEGTLGIITSVVVKLAPLVPTKVALTSFPTVQDATGAVIDILAAGLTPTCLEMLDAMSVKGTNMGKVLDRVLPEEPTVFMRFSHSMPQVLEASLARVSEIVKKHSARPLHIATDDTENEKIWHARKSIFWTQQLLVPDCHLLITDICVPITRLAEFVEQSEELVQSSGLTAPIVAHIGDGNVHRAIMFPKSAVQDGQAPASVTKLASDLSLLAISLEGTCAGEHGIGTSKRKYLERELGPTPLVVMRKLKDALDPHNLFNPGKILYEDNEEHA